MSKINDLIKEMCPNGVKYKNLDAICKINKGKQLNKDTLLNEGEFPVINGGITPSGYWNKYNFNSNLITISQGGASAGYISYQTTKFWAGAHCYIVEKFDNNVNYKYLYHFLKSKQNDLQKSQIGAGIPSVSLKDIYKLKIPVPPTEVQEEIVRILDKFGKLEAELEAELEARKSQYEFWRGELLNKEGKTKISDIFKRVKGTSITAGKMKEIEDDNGNIRIFAGGQTIVSANLKDIPNANIINSPCVIVQSRGLIDFVYYDKPLTFKNEMWAYTFANKVTVKYLYYYLKNRVDYFRMVGSQMGSMPQISLPITENFEIFLPSENEQERIVNILDKFDELTSNISKGLPAEIELRKKQYEYYRNKLLSFEELKNE